MIIFSVIYKILTIYKKHYHSIHSMENNLGNIISSRNCLSLDKESFYSLSGSRLEHIKNFVPYYFIWCCFCENRFKKIFVFLPSMETNTKINKFSLQLNNHLSKRKKISPCSYVMAVTCLFALSHIKEA